MLERQYSESVDHGDEFIADVGFEPAFTVTILHDRAEAIAGPGGTRLFRKINGGSVSGRIEGSLYPDGAGEYSLLRPDGVTEVDAHVLLRAAADGQWLYLRHVGYARPDGYFRVTAWVDADVRGEMDWVAGLFFIGTGRIAADGLSTQIDYYEVT